MHRQTMGCNSQSATIVTRHDEAKILMPGRKTTALVAVTPNLARRHLCLHDTHSHVTTHSLVPIRRPLTETASSEHAQSITAINSQTTSDLKRQIESKHFPSLTSHNIRTRDKAEYRHEERCCLNTERHYRLSAPASPSSLTRSISSSLRRSMSSSGGRAPWYRPTWPALE